MKTPNLTLNLLIGMEGVLYANIVHGATDTAEFLYFFNEAADGYTDSGVPVLQPGDIVVVDNCPTHHNNGGRVLSLFLDNLGVEYIFTPKYSPEMNPAEFAFNYIKAVLRKPEYTDMVHKNLEYAIFHVLNGITSASAAGFLKIAGYNV